MLVRIGLIVVFCLALRISFASAQEEAVPVIPDKPAGVVGEKPAAVTHEKPDAAVEQKPEASSTDTTELQKVNAACRIILDSVKVDDTAKADAIKWGVCVKTRQWGNVKARYVGMGKNADGVWAVTVQNFKAEKTEIPYSKLDAASQQVLKDIWKLKVSIPKYAEQPEIVAEAKTLEETRVTEKAKAATAAEERKKQLANMRSYRPGQRGATSRQQQAGGPRYGYDYQSWVKGNEDHPDVQARVKVLHDRQPDDSLTEEELLRWWEKNKDEEDEVFTTMGKDLRPAIKSAIATYTPEQKAQTLENAIWLYVNLTPKLQAKTVIANNGLKTTIPAPRNALLYAKQIGGSLQRWQELGPTRRLHSGLLPLRWGAWMTSREGKFPAELDADSQRSIIRGFGLCAYVPILNGGTTGAYWAKKLDVPLETPNFKDGSVLLYPDAVKMDAFIGTASRIERMEEIGEARLFNGWRLDEHRTGYERFKSECLEAEDIIYEGSHTGILQQNDFHKNAVAALVREYVRLVIEEVKRNGPQESVVIDKIRNAPPVRVEDRQPNARQPSPQVSDNSAPVPQGLPQAKHFYIAAKTSFDAENKAKASNPGFRVMSVTRKDKVSGSGTDDLTGQSVWNYDVDLLEDRH